MILYRFFATRRYAYQTNCFVGFQKREHALVHVTGRPTECTLLFGQYPHCLAVQPTRSNLPRVHIPVASNLFLIQYR